MRNTPKVDVALSFAGENRAYVDAVAQVLRDKGVKVFYDSFEEVDLWGKDLYAYLSDIYRNQARFTVMFISADYGGKLWTNHERRAAQARAFEESQEYILPVRFDNTDIPGVLPTVGYISLASRTPEELASLIAKKLVSIGGSVPTELVRKDFSAVSSHPSFDPTRCIIIAENDEGAPIPGCSITAQADNATTITGSTDENGRCELVIKTRRSYRLLIAHPEYPAAIVDRIDPAEGAKLMLPRSENIGSITIRSVGSIPGLQGSLNPILDRSNRTYLYANNIAIDGGKPQPVTFSLNVPLELEDADGNIVFATVKHIAGTVSLIQYTRRA